MRRSTSVTLGVTALLAAGLTSCSSSDGEDASAVCVDAQTQQRVDDDRCDDDPSNGSVAGSPFLWYFLGRATAIPPFGVPIVGYAGGYSVPRGVSGIRTRMPSAGAPSGYKGGSRSTVSRGGFGKSSGGIGG